MKVRITTWLVYSIFTIISLVGCSQPSDNQNTDKVSKWPQRTVNISVFSSAGGSADIASRAIAESMKSGFNADIVINNMPGSLGGSAIHYVWNQPHDGYHLVGISESVLGHSVLGLHTSTAKDWDYFIVGGTLGVISVSNSSPYKTFDELLNAINRNPNSLTIATSVPGSVWNIQWLNAMETGGFSTRNIPYAGSYPSQVAVLSGEVDIVWTGLGEQSEFIKSGHLRALAVFDSKAVNFNGQHIPAITDYIPNLRIAMPINQFVGLAIPSDTPTLVLKKLTTAFKKGMKSKRIKTFAVEQYFSLLGISGKEAKDFVQAQESIIAWTLWNSGIGSKNPKDLDIERPKLGIDRGDNSLEK
ncbi:tripartite tricarboxylate transporter substrate binding protein [Gilvimarinus agarilyticus]|uniref:tripartite tricarboxylate transporter substrate binding protein n=1 Tax=Gilvimarinus agarilyticus TaxID=679259 RepID=UPI0005A1B65E|nr:tripartite tricarboxylate transporter substrate binding protein [Gilvimarinus agarilyticus]